MCVTESSPPVILLDTGRQVGRMRRTSGWIGWTLCLCASLTVSAQDFHEDDESVLDLIREDGTSEVGAEILRCNKAAWRFPGQYLVILCPGSHESHVHRTIRRLRARAGRRGCQLEVLQSYSDVLHGFLVKMDSVGLHLALKLPHVHYIEEDSSIFAQSAPWNLQRLLQPQGGTFENATYRPPNDGGKAVVYLMDGSVQVSHREVEGRVFVTDFDNVPEEDGVKVHRQASQCESHGTHVAGVVSGLDSGVARGAVVKLVRVLNCQGKGSVSAALAGMEHIRAMLRARQQKAVVLLPFVGAFSRSLNAACRDLVANGAVVIAAAGNYRDDACLYSPSSEPEVITVGAVNSVDQLMSQGAGGTNYGRCVDVFAPGDDIVSASSDCGTCFTSRSGTSQAAAHVAGIAAVILSFNQHTAPAQVLQTMLHYSTTDTINLLPLSDSHHLTTPNLVAAMPPASSTDGKLLCRSVWSERSGVRSANRAVSRCRLGEEMMSCSSHAPDGVHAGETVALNPGQECVASNSAGGKGVYAVARCCVISGVKCQRHTVPHSGKQAACTGTGHQLIGCTTQTSADTPASLHADQKPCAGTDEARAAAQCCHAPYLECHLLENKSAGKEQVEVSCPPGWTLTDCSAVAQGSAVSEPGAKDNSCRVRATGADEAVGIAVCCRARPPEQMAALPH